MKTSNRKPLLLVFPFELLSHYLRCLELVKPLKDKFDIRFAHSGLYQSFINEAGFETFSSLAINPGEVMECSKRFDFSWINQGNLEPVFLDQVKVIRELEPYAVLGDTSPTLKMASEKTGIKYISLMNGYMSKHYAFVRKISRSHPAYKYSKKLPAKVFDTITGIAEAIAFRYVHRPFRHLRRKYKLSAYRSYLDELEGDMNLICDLPDLFPQKELPSNYKIITPLFHLPKSSSTALVDKLDLNKKTIFVSMGSTGDWKKVEFLNDPYFRNYNVITASDKEMVLKSPNIIKEVFVNVADLFPFTDLVVCHGGNGTIYQALHYGIPVLCKTTIFEQEWNVFGVQRTDLGYSIDDVKDIEDYISVIEYWVDKKGKGVLELISGKLVEERKRLAHLVI